jgi:hypothetical protein
VLADAVKRIVEPQMGADETQIKASMTICVHLWLKSWRLRGGPGFGLLHLHADFAFANRTELARLLAV